MDRIGCKRDARKALMGQLMPVSPDNRGAARTVYCDARRKVAYKVCNEADWDASNRAEVRAVERCRATDMGKRYVTPTTGWVIDGIMVNAQPVMARTGHEALRDGDGDMFLYDQVWEAAQELGVGDLHDWNWMLDADGRPWIVDLDNA